MYSVFLKSDIQVIFSTEGYNTLKESSCLGVQIKMDIHGNFSELLDLLIDQRAHDCYGLVYFSHLPVKPRQ